LRLHVVLGGDLVEVLVHQLGGGAGGLPLVDGHPDRPGQLVLQGGDVQLHALLRTADGDVVDEEVAGAAGGLQVEQGSVGGRHRVGGGNLDPVGAGDVGDRGDRVVGGVLPGLLALDAQPKVGGSGAAGR